MDVRNVSRKFEFFDKGISDSLKCVASPVNCIICRHHGIEEWKDLLPLEPKGNLLVYIKPRRSNGGLLLDGEKLAVMMVNSGWFLADRIHWFVSERKNNVLVDCSDDRKYTGESGTWFRFTRNPPNVCWADVIGNNIWQRSLEESCSWYEPLVKAFCPPDGLVLDLFYVNEFVAEAALNLGMQFIGIRKE